MEYSSTKYNNKQRRNKMLPKKTMYIHQETQSRLRRYAYAAGYSTHGRSGKALASFIDKLLDCWEEKLKLENENWD